MLLKHLDVDRLLLAIAVTAAPLTIVAAGCQRDRSVGGDFLPPEKSARAMDRALLAQAATGAAEDRMLAPVHFDGPKLNSLGEHKLQLMLQASAFLLTPEVFVTSAQPEHVEAVESHLYQLGFEPGDIDVRTGTNPAAASPAAVRLAQQRVMSEADGQQVSTDR